MIGIIKKITPGTSKNGRAFRKVEFLEGASVYFWDANIGEDIVVGKQYDFSIEASATGYLNVSAVVPVIQSDTTTYPADTTAVPPAQPVVDAKAEEKAYWANKDACIRRESALKSASRFLKDSDVTSQDDVIECAKRFLKYIEEGE